MQILILSQILMPITIGANSSDEQNHGQGLAESREGSACIIFVSLLEYFQSMRTKMEMKMKMEMWRKIRK